ncbi:hypothetical protein [Actinomadura rubrisoli]|uniref:Uncharacterized protein n=1 Tax=Actinomadura rubrisoli TaxID=2530368 RepID=A0A4R5AF56_9ACTN|nr:hypothetical protein [Actinomadura rubrisoli]TDD68582.1 hypothetical protein E1298_38270 [Actinomadura rubrisoli]
MTPYERTLAELLQLAANTVTPAPDGLVVIRARIAARRPWRRLIRRNGVPGMRPPGRPPATTPHAERTNRP